MDATTALAPHDGIGILTLSHVVFGAATRRSGTASNDNVGTSWDFKLQKKNNLKTEQRLKVYIKFSNGKKIITLSSAHFLRKLVMSFVMPFVGEE